MEEVMPPWALLTTWTGLVLLVILSLFRRWLIPKSHHEEVVGLMASSHEERMAEMESRINDRDELINELRAANAALDRRNDLLSDQVRQLVGLGKTTAAAISSTTSSTGDPGVASRGLDGGDPGGSKPEIGGGAQTSGNRTTSGRRGRRR